MLRFAQIVDRYPSQKCGASNLPHSPGTTRPTHPTPHDYIPTIAAKMRQPLYIYSLHYTNNTPVTCLQLAGLTLGSCEGLTCMFIYIDLDATGAPSPLPPDVC